MSEVFADRDGDGLTGHHAADRRFDGEIDGAYSACARRVQATFWKSGRVLEDFCRARWMIERQGRRGLAAREALVARQHLRVVLCAQRASAHRLSSVAARARDDDGWDGEEYATDT
jgi:UDP-N-acetylenolpyruvoylglucosamine reductase